MKSFILCSLFLIFAVSLFVGCGSDVVTNNNNPNPAIDTISLITKDSISLTDTSTFKDSLFYTNTADFDTLFIDFQIFAFRIEVDFDVWINTTNYFHRYVAPSGPTWDSTYHLVIPVSTISLPYNVKLFMIRNASQPNHLFSLKNIKLWYIRRS